MSTISIKETILQAVQHYCGGETQAKIVTDFHITFNSEDGTMTITDDEEQLLSSAVVCGLSGQTDECVEETLRAELSAMDADSDFTDISVFKPFSFLLDNKDGDMIAELHIVDDENIILTDEALLKGLDEELDDFLAKLLEE